MAYADYDFYVNTYGGTTVGAGDFLRLSRLASQYIDTATLGRAKGAAGDRLEAVEMAMCQLVDVFHDEALLNASTYSAEPTVASETNGSWSQSYSTRSVSETEVGLLDKRKRDALALWLGWTGLLSAAGYCATPWRRCRR